jgi:hypothetical protein
MHVDFDQVGRPQLLGGVDLLGHRLRRLRIDLMQLGREVDIADVEQPPPAADDVARRCIRIRTVQSRVDLGRGDLDRLDADRPLQLDQPDIVALGFVVRIRNDLLDLDGLQLAAMDATVTNLHLLRVIGDAIVFQTMGRRSAPIAGPPHQLTQRSPLASVHDLIRKTCQGIWPSSTGWPLTIISLFLPASSAASAGAARPTDRVKRAKS